MKNKSKIEKPGFKTFDELRAYLSSVPDISYGGCGVSAFFMYEWLKRHGEVPEIAFLYDDNDFWGSDKEYHDKNDSALKGNGEPTAAGHCAIHWQGKYWDADESVDKLDFAKHDWRFNPELTQIISEDFLIKALYHKGVWNDAFDRAKYLPEIEKKTGMKFPANPVVKMAENNLKKAA